MALPGQPRPPRQPVRRLSSDAIRIRSRVAAVGAAGAWALVVLAIYGNIGGPVPKDPWNPLVIVACIALALSFLLWFVAIFEYLRERPERYPYLWLVLLFAGPVGGPLLFYYLVWRTRYGRPNTSLERTREK